MKHLLNIEKCVKEELENNYSARTNDYDLILGVVKRFGIDVNIPFRQIVKRKDLPSFKSIMRARRKVQAEYPELKDAQTTQARQEKQEIYKKYSQEK